MPQWNFFNFFFFFFFFCNSTYSLYLEHWIIQEPVYVLHLFTCHGRIMPRLAELLFNTFIGTKIHTNTRACKPSPDSYFSQKMRFDILCQFSGKKKKEEKYLKCYMLKFLPNMLNFKEISGGFCMSGHFIWTLWNKPLACFINFIWNDLDCNILFIIHLLNSYFMV